MSGTTPPVITLENIPDQNYPSVGYLVFHGASTTTDTLEWAGFEQESNGNIIQRSPWTQLEMVVAGGFNPHFMLPYRPNTIVTYGVFVRERANPMNYVQSNWFNLTTPATVP